VSKLNLRFHRRAVLALAIAAALVVLVLIVAERVVGWRTVAQRAQGVPVETWIIFALLMGTSYVARVFRFWTLVRPLH